jgi:hypothetical protein
MNQGTTLSESFVIRLWIETSDGSGEAPTWRGHVTHVASDDKRYVDDLFEIPEVIAPHLVAMGISLGRFWRMKRWLVTLIP